VLRNTDVAAEGRAVEGLITVVRGRAQLRPSLRQVLRKSDMCGGWSTPPVKSAGTAGTALRPDIPVAARMPALRPATRCLRGVATPKTVCVYHS